MSDVTTTPTIITAAADIKSDSEPWSVLENLILAQAIYKCGDTNWVAIARTIKGHPQIHRSSNFFSQKSCAIQYTLLLENLETETSRSKQTRANDADIPTVVKLAGQLYNQRILEIKALIRKDEERFRSLVAELDDIRQGKWDNQLEEELKKNPPPPEPEQELEASTNEAATLPAETSQQPQQDGEPLQIDTAAPSSLSSPVSLTSLEKPEDASQAMQEAAPEVEQPVTSTASNTEGAPENQTRSEHKDVEMEEAGEPESTSETPVVSAPTPVASSNTPAANVDEDVEMEDITSTDSPSVVSEAATPVEVIKSTMVQDEGSNLKVEVDNGSIASSPTSASDLSPPGAMEEEEDEDEEDGDENDTPKKETGSSTPAGDKTKDDSEVDENDLVKEGDSIKEEEVDKEADEEADEEEDEEADKDENADQEMEVESRESPDGTSEAGDDSKMDEDVVVKSEDPMNDTEQEEEEEDAAKDGHDEGATSADEEEEEEEEAVTKSPKKPRKIKTSVPVKRKRRSGRSGADVEDGYNSSDSEATESVSNMSDQRNQMDDKKWKKILMIIWTEITNHRYGAVFMQPIKEHDAPGYYLMIKRPMDLKSIKERIRDGQITNADEFHRDVLLMFMNALMYNGEDTEVYQMAMAMMTEVEQIIKNFKSSQSFAPTGVSGGTGGSGNASSSTTPTTRTAGSDGLLGTSSSSSGQPSSRRRKSSGMEMTPIE
ncbi:hypothetical protein BGX30_005466 [Mortierella sp. GBA39]|nr:hypothetical protein BGX30_005466 [Mortierella sp. GBA39]